MKKSNYKIFIFIVVGIINFYFLFVIFDCIKLKTHLENNLNNLCTTSDNIKPIIVINTISEQRRLTYYGIGYSIKYYVNTINSCIYGAKFKFLDKILIWGTIT